jgi:AcrR family transcriptional regulator
MTVTPKAKGRHHHGALRRALLDAVAEVVLESGPEAVSLRECARRAGVSHSAAAPHFGDKRGLLTAFATEGNERLAAAMEAAVAALPTAETPAARPAETSPARLAATSPARLAATGRGYIAFARANPAHFRLMFRTDLIDQSDPAWLAAATRSFQILSDAMAAFAPDMDERGRRARLTLAWSAVHGFCALRAEGAGRALWQPEARAAEVAEDLLALIVSACAAGVR